MSSARARGLLAVLLATGLPACAMEEVEDLGTIDPDGKADSVLPRTVEIELEAGEDRWFRVTTAAFVAALEQAEEVPAQLSAKNFDLELESAVARSPRLEVGIGDGVVRTWTLRVHNRGEETLRATLVVDRPRELGLVSDIDKTVMPPEVDGAQPPPYPGVASLLWALEADAAGDLHFVTARTPERVDGVAEWMAEHGVPAGLIETGISGVPFVAEKEKVADISRIFEARGQQRFVLLGDSSHRDPEAYAQVRGLFPDRVAAIFIHKVTATVGAHRVEGMHLVNSYAEAAAIAFGLELLTEAEARAVMSDAQAEGLAITDGEIDALIEAARSL